MPTVNDPNPTMLWVRAMAEELARSGVRHACVAPGNRSGPLALALAAQPMKLWSHIDERSAGFFALGLAKALREPVALLCTTGTAAANLLPAVIEARYARVPLVVLTADRPPDLRDVGANQATGQAGLFGQHARWALDLPPPAVADRPLRHLRTQVCRAVATAQGPPGGPVHLNVPLPKPLEPTEIPGSVPADFAARFPLAARGRLEGMAFVQASSARSPPDPAALDRARALLHEPRGLIVAGPAEDPALPEAAIRLSRTTGYPLLADPLSGLRFGPHADHVVGAYDALLQTALSPPAIVVRLGAAPTSDALLNWLEAAQPQQIALDEGEAWRDPLQLPGERIQGDPALACDALAQSPAAPAARPWLEAWSKAERAARQAASKALGESWFEGSALAAAVDALPEGGTVFVSNSLPIRDLDRYVPARSKAIRVLGNRGASGIDGITSTALGVAAANQGRVLLLTGDLAFLHDLPGLLAVKRCGVGATMVVMHNDGGRIFDQLPAARTGGRFEELFVTPHGLDLRHAASLFGLGYEQALDGKSLRDQVASALECGETRVVEAHFDPSEAKAHRRGAESELAAQIQPAMRGSLLAR